MLEAEFIQNRGPLLHISNTDWQLLPFVCTGASGRASCRRPSAFKRLVVSQTPSGSFFLLFALRRRTSIVSEAEFIQDRDSLLRMLEDFKADVARRKGGGALPAPPAAGSGGAEPGGTGAAEAAGAVGDLVLLEPSQQLEGMQVGGHGSLRLVDLLAAFVTRRQGFWACRIRGVVNRCTSL